MQRSLAAYSHYRSNMPAHNNTRAPALPPQDYVGPDGQLLPSDPADPRLEAVVREARRALMDKQQQRAGEALDMGGAGAGMPGHYGYYAPLSGLAAAPLALPAPLPLPSPPLLGGHPHSHGDADGGLFAKRRRYDLPYGSEHGGPVLELSKPPATAGLRPAQYPPQYPPHYQQQYPPAYQQQQQYQQPHAGMAVVDGSGSRSAVYLRQPPPVPLDVSSFTATPSTVGAPRAVPASVSLRTSSPRLHMEPPQSQQQPQQLMQLVVRQGGGSLTGVLGGGSGPAPGGGMDDDVVAAVGGGAMQLKPDDRTATGTGMAQQQQQQTQQPPSSSSGAPANTEALLLAALLQREQQREQQRREQREQQQQQQQLQQEDEAEQSAASVLRHLLRCSQQQTTKAAGESAEAANVRRSSCGDMGSGVAASSGCGAKRSREEGEDGAARWSPRHESSLLPPASGSAVSLRAQSSGPAPTGGTVPSAPASATPASAAPAAGDDVPALVRRFLAAAPSQLPRGATLQCVVPVSEEPAAAVLLGYTYCTSGSGSATASPTTSAARGDGAVAAGGADVADVTAPARGSHPSSPTAAGGLAPSGSAFARASTSAREQWGAGVFLRGACRDLGSTFSTGEDALQAAQGCVRLMLDCLVPLAPPPSAAAAREEHRPQAPPLPRSQPVKRSWPQSAHSHSEEVPAPQRPQQPACPAPLPSRAGSGSILETLQRQVQQQQQSMRQPPSPKEVLKPEQKQQQPLKLEDLLSGASSSQLLALLTRLCQQQQQ